MSIFQYEGRAILPLVTRITGNTATTIIDASGSGFDAYIYVPWFQVNEHAGSTATLTVDIYDGTNTDYLGDDAGTTWNAKAVATYGSYRFTQGLVIPKGSKLRITSGDAAGKFKVIGTYQIIKQG